MVKPEPAQTATPSSESQSEAIARRLRRFSALTGWAVAVLGVLVLIGWFLDLDAIASFTTGVNAMRPNGAVCFILTGVSIAFLQSSAQPRTRRIGAGLAFAVLLIGFLTLVEYVAGWDLHIDELLFDDPVAETEHPNRMAVRAAACFTALGLALMLVDGRGSRFATALRFGSLLTALAGVIGYLYGVAELYRIGVFNSVALHTSLGLVLASAGALLLRPERLAVLTSSDQGGIVLRRWALPAAVSIVALGYLSRLGQRAGWYESEFGLAVLGFASFMLILLITWRISVALHRVDGARVAALADLRSLNRELDDRVQSRTAALAASVEQIRAVTATAFDGIVSADDEGVILFANASAARMFGWADGELEGQPLAVLIPDLMPAQLRAGDRQGFARSLAGGEQRIIGRVVGAEGRRQDGTTFPIELSMSTWLQDDAHRFTAILRDVTERRLAAEAEAALANDLKRSNAELEQFAYVASHDLQEPLRHIAAFVQKLGDRYRDVVDERGQRYIGYVVEGATHMQQLIEGLLEFSRVGRSQAPLGPVDLDAIVANALRAVSGRVAEADAVATAKDLPVVRGDADPLYRVFVNLLSNAIKFARPGIPPVVSITAKPAGPLWWDVLVSDNGIGIEPKYRARAFDIFERLNGDEYPGTGIGLPVVRRIVQAHGGDVVLTESESGGTTVKLRLQAYQHAPIQSQTEMSAPRTEAQSRAE